MEIKSIIMLGLLLSSAIFVAFASEDGAVMYTKENMKYTDYLDPATAEINVNIEDAKSVVLYENSDIVTESIESKLIDDNKFGLIWVISSKTKNDRSILAGVDASTGELIYIYDGSKNVQGESTIDKEKALEIASKYLDLKVSKEKLVDLKLKYSTYVEPHADDLPGTYEIKYARIINGITSMDGIKIRVNAETGEVSSYRTTWLIDEEQVLRIDTKPSITEEKSEEILKEYMSNIESIGIEKANSIKVNSSELVWRMDDNKNIHLSRWIQFTDSSFTDDDTCPASVWIDAHSGEVLLFAYARD